MTVSRLGFFVDGLQPGLSGLVSDWVTLNSNSDANASNKIANGLRGPHPEPGSLDLAPQLKLA